MSSCTTCVRRKLDCDALKPRCSPCRRSHVKCTYDPSPPTFEFRDETEHILAESSRMRKRQRMSQGPASYTSSHDEQTVQTWSEDVRATSESTFPLLDGNMMPWIDGMFDSYLDQSWGQDPQTPVIGHFALSTQEGGLTRPTNQTAQLDSSSLSPATGDHASTTGESHQLSPSSPSVVSDHVLALHYTQNLTSRYSSKKQGWNFHTYFFNRFSSSHPFVMSALYAWTSAHLLCAGAIASEENSQLHYAKCVCGLKRVFNMEVRPSAGLDHDLHWMTAVTRDDDFDAIAVALFFLASTDLILSRPGDLRNLLDLEATIIKRRNYRGPDSVFIKIATWFCFLDARASAFGTGEDRIIQALGDEKGLLHILRSSQDFLRKEYDILYPHEEQQRDQAHLPLYVVTCRLVALIGRISRSCRETPNSFDGLEIQDTLKDLKKMLDSKTEGEATEENVLSIYFTTSALYHAVQIYHSRVFHPSDPSYSADDHAVMIITTIDRYYQVLKRPRSEPPPTKIWPLPLVLAAIEARDSIYRGWAVQKIKEYGHAGKHYLNACAFAERVQAKEELDGRRVDLAAINESMGDDFII